MHPPGSRCRWATTPLLAAYHDAEWGRPCHDDRALFELLVLEGAQAGLSWQTILAKRDNYRAAFAGFDPAAVAAFADADVARLLADAGIVRHRGKLEAAIGNAQAVRRIQARDGSFDTWLWRFVDGRPLVTRRPPDAPAPTVTPLAETVSAALRREGCRFVGPTIIQSFLQATGVRDDHERDCWRAA